MRAQLRLLGGLALLVAVMAAITAPAATVQAATFTVNSTGDVGDFAPGNGVCDSTSGAGVCTLRAAINEANALGGSHTINLGSGTYQLTMSGAGEEAGFTGDLDVYANITFIGAGAAATIVDGLQSDRVFDLHTAGATTFQALTITKGAPPSGTGGGILAVGPVTLTNATVSNNASAGVNGKALTISGSTITGNLLGGAIGTDITLTSSTVDQNTGYGVKGTSITADGSVISKTAGANVTTPGGLVASVSAIVRNSTVNGNESVGIYSPIATVETSTIKDNGGSGVAPGGISGGNVTVTNSTLSGNFTTTVVNGTAINAAVSATITGSIINNNWSSNVFTTAAVAAPTLVMSNTIIRDNKVCGTPCGLGFGSGVSAQHATITDSTFTGNRSALSIGDGTIERTTIKQNENGPLNINGTTTLRNVTVSQNTIGAGGIRITAGTVTVEDSTVTANAAGLTADGGGGFTLVGPGVTLNLTRTTVNGNTVDGPGGGISATATNSTVVLTNSTISDNQATGFGGGIHSKGTVTMVNTKSTGNTSQSAGGGIYAGNLTMAGSEVSGNTGKGAGGILSFSATLDTSSVLNNTATADGGGGLFATGPVQITRSTIADNTATNNSGGGINSSAALTIATSTVSGNKATNKNGGGIYSTGTVTLDNSTISGNSATGDGTNTGQGGGLFVSPATTSAPMSWINATIANNASPRGSGLYTIASALQLKNVLLATNTGSTDCFRVSPLISQGHNLDGGTSCSFAGAGDLSNANPNLAPLANNGGPTKTQALQAGSAALDAGDNTGCPAIDQRGEARPKDGNGDGTAVCDIGAFEAPSASGPPAPTPCTPRPRVALATQQTGPGTIRGTLSATGTSNTLSQLQITGLANATVTVNGAAVAAGQTVTLPAGSVEAVVVVTRTAGGQAFTARLAVTDGCGAWPTFLGGGTGVQ